uniref:Uncharacterized protein n=1 Tax=Timema genevievae TaxID=629358 RepID=A0A7R9JQX5_TIMGE|nr:unnamed protein product [Timema genevievae]
MLASVTYKCSGVALWTAPLVAAAQKRVGLRGIEFSRRRAMALAERWSPGSWGFESPGLGSLGSGPRRSCGELL